MPKPTPQYEIRREPLPRESRWHSVISSWGGSIIIGLMGLLAGLLGAKATEESTQRKMYLELRIKHADEIAKQFAKYSEAQARMKIRCDFMLSEDEKDSQEASRAVLSAEKIAQNQAIHESRQKKLIEIGSERQVTRDLLQGEFGALRLYFGPNITSKVDDFVLWDRPYRYALCKDLPKDPFAWEPYMKGILESIRSEIKQR